MVKCSSSHLLSAGARQNFQHQWYRLHLGISFETLQLGQAVVMLQLLLLMPLVIWVAVIRMREFSLMEDYLLVKNLTFLVMVRLDCALCLLEVLADFFLIVTQAFYSLEFLTLLKFLSGLFAIAYHILKTFLDLIRDKKEYKRWHMVQK